MAQKKGATAEQTESEPTGLEKLWIEQLIHSLHASGRADSKVALCCIAATYVRHRWSLPVDLSDFIAEVLQATADGKRPFQRPRGKRAPYVEMVTYVRKLEKKGTPLAVAKERARTVFGASRQTINLALRKFDVDPGLNE